MPVYIYQGLIDAIVNLSGWRLEQLWHICYNNKYISWALLGEGCLLFQETPSLQPICLHLYFNICLINTYISFGCNCYYIHPVDEKTGVGAAQRSWTIRPWSQSL